MPGCCFPRIFCLKYISSQSFTHTFECGRKSSENPRCRACSHFQQLRWFSSFSQSWDFKHFELNFFPVLSLGVHINTFEMKMFVTLIYVLLSFNVQIRKLKWNLFFSFLLSFLDVKYSKDFLDFISDHRLTRPTASEELKM